MLYRPWRTKSLIMNENVDIFISTHVQPVVLPQNTVYKLVSQKDMEFNTVLPVYYVDKGKMGDFKNLPRGLSEFYNMYYVRHFIEKKDYIGFNHYRAFFKFFNNIPNIKEEFKNYDILTNLWYVPSLQEMSVTCWCQDGFLMFKDIIKDCYPDEWNDFNEYLLQKEFYSKNLFIMKTEDFNEMFDKAIEVMRNYLDMIDCHSDAELYEYAKKQQEEGKLSNIINDYSKQLENVARTPAFIGEMFESFYIWKYFKRKKILDVFTTMEQKIYK